MHKKPFGYRFVHRGNLLTFFQGQAINSVVHYPFIKVTEFVAWLNLLVETKEKKNFLIFYNYRNKIKCVNLQLWSED